MTHSVFASIGLLGGALVCTVALAVGVAVRAAEAAAPHWSYSGESGPEQVPARAPRVLHLRRLSDDATLQRERTLVRAQDAGRSLWGAVEAVRRALRSQQPPDAATERPGGRGNEGRLTVDKESRLACCSQTSPCPLLTTTWHALSLNAPTYSTALARLVATCTADDLAKAVVFSVAGTPLTLSGGAI